MTNPDVSAVTDLRANRRELLKAGVAAGIGVAAITAAAEIAKPTAAATPIVAENCTLTPELSEGPFYIAEELIRQDITEGKPGLPLELRITINDATACAPLANAAVDIWHCDADGYYSGVTGENPGDPDSVTTTEDNVNTTFMRGVQITDGDGAVTFKTIYPGWYRGRDIHIHMKVHIGGDAEEAADGSLNAGKGEVYVGGHVAHTGQLFFDAAISDEVATLEPYASRGTERTRLENDRVFQGHTSSEPGFFLTLLPVDEGDIRGGLIGAISLAVDPAATPDPTGSGGKPAHG